jgi:hypothetical protein
MQSDIEHISVLSAVHAPGANGGSITPVAFQFHFHFISSRDPEL